LFVKATVVGAPLDAKVSRTRLARSSRIDASPWSSFDRIYTASVPETLARSDLRTGFARNSRATNVIGTAVRKRNEKRPPAPVLHATISE